MVLKAKAFLSRLPVGIVLMFLAVTVLVPITSAEPARADLCADAPVPSNPWDHDLSMIYRPKLEGGVVTTPKPAQAFGADRDTTLAQMYGINYRFVAYDASCNWGTDSLFTFAADTDSSMFAFAEYPVAFATIASVFTLDDSWRNSLDGAVDGVVKELGAGLFASLAGLMILLGGVGVLLGARKGDISKAFTNLMWVIVVIGGVAATMAIPNQITDTSEDALMSVVDTGVAALPGASDAPEDATSMSKVGTVIEPLNTDILYRNWLQGQFGSAEGVGAKNYGGQIYKATHLDWWEGRTVINDPTGEGQKIIDAKQKLFKDTVDKIEKEDPRAFEYLKGKNTSRMGSTATAILQAWLTLPFFVIGMLSVGVALVTIRIIVMLLPIILLGGLFEPSRNWMLGVLQKYSGNIVRAPLTFIAALANAAIVSAIYKSDAPAFGKLLLAVVTMIVLWGIAKPQVTPVPLMRSGANGVKKLVTLIAAKKFLDSRAPKTATKSATPSASRKAGQQPVAADRQVSGSPVRGALGPGGSEVPVRRVNTEAAQQPMPGVPVNRRIGGTRKAPETHRLEAGAVPTSGAPSAPNADAQRPVSDGPAAGTTNISPTVIPVDRRLPGRPVSPATSDQGAPQVTAGTGPTGAGRPPLSGTTPGSPGGAASDAPGSGSASGAQSSARQEPMADTSWQSSYETLELRDDAAGPGAASGTVIFTPKNAQRENRQGGVSEGNLSYNEGKPQFNVWSPAESGTNAGGNTQSPRRESGPAA